jgi:hypothetical protein
MSFPGSADLMFCQKGFWMVIDKAADILKHDPRIRLMTFGMLPNVAPDLGKK